MANRDSARFDIVAVDKEGRAVLVVEAKTRELAKEDERHLANTMQRLPDVVPFAMLADPAQIRLLRWDGTKLSDPVVTLPTREVLLPYEPAYGRKRIFEDYFASLVESWLRDLAYHWKSDTPPGKEEMQKGGLLSLLQDGTTIPDAEVARV